MSSESTSIFTEFPKNKTSTCLLMKPGRKEGLDWIVKYWTQKKMTDEISHEFCIDTIAFYMVLYITSSLSGGKCTNMKPKHNCIPNQLFAVIEEAIMFSTLRKRNKSNKLWFNWYDSCLRFIDQHVCSHGLSTLFFCPLGVRQLLSTIVSWNLTSLYTKGMYCLYSVQETAQILVLQVVCFRNVLCCIKHSYLLKVSCNKSSKIWTVIIPTYSRLGHLGTDSAGV